MALWSMACMPLAILALASAVSTAVAALDQACGAELARFCPGQFGRPELAGIESECIRNNLDEGNFSEACVPVIEKYKRSKHAAKALEEPGEESEIDLTSGEKALVEEKAHIQQIVASLSPLLGMGIVRPEDHMSMPVLVATANDARQRETRTIGTGCSMVNQFPGPLALQMARTCRADLERLCNDGANDTFCYGCLHGNILQLSPPCRVVVVFGSLWHRLSTHADNRDQQQAKGSLPQPVRMLPIHLPILLPQQRHLAVIWHMSKDSVECQAGIFLGLVATWLLLVWALCRPVPAPTLRMSAAVGGKAKPTVITV